MALAEASKLATQAAKADQEAAVLEKHAKTEEDRDKAANARRTAKSAAIEAADTQALADAAGRSPTATLATYEVTVKTGNVPFAGKHIPLNWLFSLELVLNSCLFALLWLCEGTQAKVYLELYGRRQVADKDGNLTWRTTTTGRLELQDRKSTFERKAVDKFSIAAPDVGQLTRAKVSLDATGAQDGWFLETLEVKAPSITQPYLFNCHAWLASDKGDKCLEKVFKPQMRDDDAVDTVLGPYEITVHTGDVNFAGTDATVFATLYGELGKTDELPLSKSTRGGNPFERNQVCYSC